MPLDFASSPRRRSSSPSSAACSGENISTMLPIVVSACSATKCWPVGARTINYRWETDGSGLYRYLYLVPNPAVWAVSLLAVILSVAVLIGKEIGLIP